MWFWLADFLFNFIFFKKRLDGGTPIHLACRLGAPEILQCLYEHDPAAFQHSLVDKEVMTPLHRSVTIPIAACFLISFSPLAILQWRRFSFEKVEAAEKAEKEKLQPSSHFDPSDR